MWISAQIAYRILGSREAVPGVDILVALSPRTVMENTTICSTRSAFTRDGPAVHAAVMNLVHAPAGDSLFLKVAPDCVTTSVFQDRASSFIAA